MVSKLSLKSALCTALAVSAAMLAVTQLSAQATTTYSEYSAKFLCGVPSAAVVATEQIELAEYSTSINIHNPNLFSTDKPLAFLKKAVISLPEGVTKVPPSGFVQDTLINDYAEQVTCTTIRRLLGTAAPAAPAFIEGYVVIITLPASNPNQLDVTGVYTSSNKPPVSLQVVPIAGRIIVPPVGAAFEGTIVGSVE